MKLTYLMFNRLQFLGLMLFGAVTLASAASSPEDTTCSSEGARLGLLKQTTLLLGQKVLDRKEKNIRRIEDVVLDLANGQAVATLVAPGSKTHILLPSPLYSYVSTGKILLRVDRKACQSAPSLPASSQVAWPAEVLSPAFAHFDQQPPTAPARLMSAKSLLGANIMGRGSERLGTIKDIVVDLPVSRLVYIVVCPAGNQNPADLLYLLPPSILQTDGETLRLDSDTARFIAGPHFGSQFWSDLAFPDLAAAVDKYYGLGAAGMATPATTAASVERPNGSAPPGSPRSDHEMTQAILGEIVNQTHGFTKLAIVVTANRGRVTLRGTVKNERQKREIVAAAERVAGPGNVDDQLETGARKRG